MRKIFCGTSGTDAIPKTHNLSSVNAGKELLSALAEFYGSDLVLRPAQEEALVRQNVLSGADNVVIATPTNSGKSLIAYLLLLDAAAKGQTAVLVEPLRALAYEKAEELTRIAGILKARAKLRVDVAITTGDYRLTDEFMYSDPAGGRGAVPGRIVVATPERLDAISRIPEHQDWFRGIRLICFDEAHLLGDARRGAALEVLIAYLRSLKSELRLILMSATVSNSSRLAAWLAPCRVIDGVPRCPPLDKWVFCQEDGEDVNGALIAEIRDVLKEPGTGVLVFVYQTAAAESLARSVAEALSGQALDRRDPDAPLRAGAAWFHSRMSAASRARVLSAVRAGSVRVVVSTTALSLGVNLPATHVFVRDVLFVGSGELSIPELLQMLGRAGRGDRKGTGVVFLGGKSLSKESTVVRGLRAETVPELRSRLAPAAREGYYGSAREDPDYIDRVGGQIMGVLSRCGSMSPDALDEFLSGSFAGDAFRPLPAILQKLSDWKLAYWDADTDEYALTHLGKVASRCYLPPLTAANIGQLFRDLLEDEPDGKHISRLSAIDLLIILCLTGDENRLFTRTGKEWKLRAQAYMEGLPPEEKSYLYRTWIARAPETLCGSARADGAPRDAEKRVGQSVLTAMLLYDVSRGYPLAGLRRDYRVDVEEIQERLRDNAIWILCGMERLLEVKSFYYHLTEHCGAGRKQIKGVESALAEASRKIFALVANLKFRSSLGELMRGVRRVYPNAARHPGEGTIRKLEAAGITNMRQLSGQTAEDMLQFGIRREYAAMIAGYIQKRMS